MNILDIDYSQPSAIQIKEYKKIPKIYIAGKLNDKSADKYILNLKKMIEWGDAVMKLNMSVFIPGVDFLAGMMCGWEYRDYFDNSQPWLLSSDAIFLVPGWETSKGVEKELGYAKEAGIPTFDSLDELYEHFNKRTVINSTPKISSYTDESYLKECISDICESGKKYDYDKLRYDLIPVNALEGVAEIMTYGASKYGSNNWQGVRPADRYFAASQRHLMSIRKGEHDDPESGLKHLDHAITSLMMYRELLYNSDKHGK